MFILSISNFPRYSESMSGLVAFMAPSLLQTNFIHSLKWSSRISIFFNVKEGTYDYVSDEAERVFEVGSGRWGYRGRERGGDHAGSIRKNP